MGLAVALVVAVAVGLVAAAAVVVAASARPSSVCAKYVIGKIPLSK